MKRPGITMIFFIIIMIAIQFVPSEQPANQAIESFPPLTSDAEYVFQKACVNCHTTETNWPWYSAIAPFSWLIRHHVAEGRAYLNLGAWEQYPAEKQRELIHRITSEVQKNKMPPKSYIFVHQEARLTEIDKESIENWAQQVIHLIPQTIHE
jgi:mono/diheme cytochrome c family protein